MLKPNKRTQQKHKKSGLFLRYQEAYHHHHHHSVSFYLSAPFSPTAPLSSSHDFINMNYLLLPVCRVPDLCRRYIKSRCRYKRGLAGHYSSPPPSSPPPPLLPLSVDSGARTHWLARRSLPAVYPSIHQAHVSLALGSPGPAAGRCILAAAPRHGVGHPAAVPDPERRVVRQHSDHDGRGGERGFFSFTRRGAAAVWRRVYYKSRGCVWESECVSVCVGVVVVCVVVGGGCCSGKARCSMLLG